MKPVIIAMVEDDDRLLCYPSIVRLVPGDLVLEIDKRRVRALRPSVVVAPLQRAQSAGITITARTKPVKGFVTDVSFTDLYRALDLSSGARLPNNPVGQASAGITQPFGSTRTSLGISFGVAGSDGDERASFRI